MLSTNPFGKGKRLNPHRQFRAMKLSKVKLLNVFALLSFFSCLPSDNFLFIMGNSKTTPAKSDYAIGVMNHPSDQIHTSMSALTIVQSAHKQSNDDL